MTRAHRGLEAVLFDCDGVLVDSERVAVELEVHILAELGWEISREEVVDRFLGVSDADYLAQIEQHLGRDLPSSWLSETEHRYREAFARELRPVPGVEEALSAIERAGLVTAVASSGSHEKMRFTLGLTGLYDRFAGRLFSAVEVEKGKPEPDLFLYAATSIGVEPASCVVVEDSLPGLEAARAAQMRPIAYAGGLVPLERLRLAGVTVIDDMRELPNLVLGPLG